MVPAVQRALLVLTLVSEAALINYNFNGTIDYGALLGEISNLQHTSLRMLTLHRLPIF
jgi:hypothetical protein